MSVILPYRIIAVDPAVGLSGWVVLDVECLDPLSIRVIDHGKIDGAKLVRDLNIKKPNFTKQYCVTTALRAFYGELAERFRPHKFVSEGAFGHLHLSAFTSLTLIIREIRHVSEQYLNDDVATVPPTVSKLSFTENGGADKDLMRICYKVIPWLIRLPRSQNGTEEEISEHEIDAISHGCAYVRAFMTQTVTWISGKERRAQKRERQKIREAKQQEKLELQKEKAKTA